MIDGSALIFSEICPLKYRHDFVSFFGRNVSIDRGNIYFNERYGCCQITSHSAYVATETELYGAKIDGFLYPNFM